jgi:hypothetical protein
MDLNKRLSELRSFLTGILATKFHYLIMLVIISGILVTLLIDRLDFTIRGLIYFIPGVLVAIFLFGLYRKGKRFPDSLILLRADRKFFQIFFVLLFVLSLLALYFSSYRPWYYFALITALFCVIFIQIFSDNLKPTGILLEISCVLGNLIFGLQLKYPFFFGFTDIIPHLYLTKITMLSGHIIPVDLDYSYAWFPLYHIFIAEGTNLFGIDVKTTFILLTSLSFILLVWVIYLLFNHLLKNPQASLLICLIFSTTPIAITYSTYVVTQTMAFIGFIIFLFLAHKQIQTSKWRSFSILTILFSLYLIVVHQVSIIQIIFLLIIFVLLEVLIHDFFVIKTRIIAFMIVTATTYWMFTSFFFTSIIVQTADSATVPELSQVRSQVQAVNAYIFLQDNFHIAIAIFLTFLGIGYLCWAYRSKYPSVIGLFVLITCPLFFPSPITASRMATITFRTDRFSLLVSPFFAYAIAIGFLVLLFIMYDNKYTRKIALFFGIMIFSFLCFSALTIDNATDSKDLTFQRGRVYFTEPEITAFDFVPNFVAYNSSVTSDKFTSRMFEKWFFSETTMLNLPSYSSTSTFQSTDPIIFDTGYFILRNQELEENGLGFYSGNAEYGQTYLPTPEVLAKFSNLTYRYQKIYDNQKVTVLAH